MSTADRAHAREITHHTAILDRRERDYPNSQALLCAVNETYLKAGDVRGWGDRLTVDLGAWSDELNHLPESGEADITASVALCLAGAVVAIRKLLECERRKA